MSLEDIMKISSIEAHKVRDVSTIYVPGEYLYIESDEKVIVILKVIMMELLVNKDPKIYRKYFVLKK